MRKLILSISVLAAIFTNGFATMELEESEMQKDLQALENLSKFRLKQAVKLPKESKAVTEIDCVKCNFKASK